MVVSVLALLPHTLKVTSPKFGWESGCPFDDFFPDYSQHANSQNYSGESDSEDDESENESG